MTEVGQNDEDREAILHLHREWWAANESLDIERMRVLFPRGAGYHMFNLNGHPYFGIEEKVKLWQFLRDNGLEFGRPEITVVRLTVCGDMAWLAAEGCSNKTMLGDDRRRLKYYRSTEVYQRDDGAGAPEWRMWHFHGSYIPGPAEPRPAFGDTYDSRGLGWKDPQYADQP